MGERKVLNKYYPPDFDPSLIPKNRQPPADQIKVRTMLPFSIRCDTCNEYIWKARKFNARKEQVLDQDYMGIKIWRFYIKCTLCSSEITFKTDPEHGSYVCEHGAHLAHAKFTREPGDGAEEVVDGKEEETDKLSQLEARQEESKREMEAMDQLSELRRVSERNGKLSAVELERRFRGLQGDVKGVLRDEDEERIRELFGKRSGQVVKRLGRDTGVEDNDSLFAAAVKKRKADVQGKEKPLVKVNVKEPTTLCTFLSGYSSSSSDES